jgi:hypothetical protein
MSFGPVVLSFPLSLSASLCHLPPPSTARQLKIQLLLFLFIFFLCASVQRFIVQVCSQVKREQAPVVGTA